jgi:hypothetical protein
MESTKGQERPERRREDEPAGIVRCPFCHDGIDVDAHAWVVCHRCLARHHPGCWDEAVGCATCGDRRRLATAKKEPAPRRRSVSLALAGVLGVGFGLGALAAATLGRGAEPAAERSSQVAARPLPAFVRERVEFIVSEGRLDDALAYLDRQEQTWPGAERELDELRRGVERLRGD